MPPRDLNPLVAAYGPALLDRAVLDALCRLLGVSFHDAVRANLVGLAPADALPRPGRLRRRRVPRRACSPADSLHARHTVGLVDPITAADQPAGARVGDGLPETLEEVVAAYGHALFKLKVGGDVTADVERLGAIAGVLDRLPERYHVTLDGNEQYDDVEGVLELWRAHRASRGLAPAEGRDPFVEQPISAQTALTRDVGALSAPHAR